MAADPAILKRIRACLFARGGRVLVRYRAKGYSLFARRSGEPLARLRLTGEGDDVVLLGQRLIGKKEWAKCASAAQASPHFGKCELNQWFRRHRYIGPSR